MKLRVVPYVRLARVAEACGFSLVRTRSSHNIFRNAEGRTVTIPDHGAQVIVRSLLRKILRDLGLSVAEYHRLLDD